MWTMKIIDFDYNFAFDIPDDYKEIAKRYSSYSGSTPKYYISPQPNNPYVISNHSTLIGSNRLNEGGNLITGDGISQTVETLPINQILSTDNRYSYSKNAYYSGNSGSTNSTVFSNYASKLALFSTEVSGYSGNDFALIVADDSDAGLWCNLW